MVVDFYGIPGSGKTYTSYNIVNYLKLNKLKSINILDKSRYNLAYKLFFKTWRVLLKRSDEFKKIKSEIIIILGNISGIKPQYSDSDLDCYVIKLAIQILEYNRFSKRNTIYIYDEGLFQIVATMAINFSLSKKKIHELADYIVAIHNISLYIDVPVQIAFDSFRKRDRHDCYIDEFADEKLLEFLKKNEDICNEIVRYAKSSKISRNDDLGKTVKEIIKYYRLNTEA